MDADEDVLDAVLVAYREMRPVRDIWRDCGGRIPTSLAAQALLLARVLRDPICAAHPPAREYTRRFVARYVDRVDEDGEAVHEDLLALALSLARADRPALPPPCFKTFTPANDALPPVTVRVHQSFHEVGLTTWPAGLFLAEYLCAQRQLVAGRRVIELGAGVGVTGAVVARLAPRALLLTDWDPSGAVVANLAENMAINGCGAGDDTVSIRSLDWHELEPADASAHWAVQFAPDLVLAADVAYEPTLFPPLAAAVRALLRPRSGSARIATAVRSDATAAALFAALAAAGLAVRTDAAADVPRAPLWRSLDRTAIVLHTVTLAE